MGERGPAKKPTAVKKRRGTFQKYRDGGPELPVEAPPMPPDLGPREQVVWRSMIEDLQYAGVLSRVDGKSLRLFCESWIGYTDANDAVAERGAVITETTSAGKKRMKANPAVMVRAQLWKECYQLLRQFGLTPSARCGIKPGESGQRPDEQAKVANILKIAR